MSPKPNVLRTNELAATMPRMSVRSDQARLRIRAEMERQKLSQREVADLLTWSQSRVGKILTGRVEMTVDDLDALCFALGITIVEVVRDHGLEFCAEMSPTELRILERLRQLPPHTLEAIKTIIQFNQGSVERRSATAKKNLLGTPRR